MACHPFAAIGSDAMCGKLASMVDVAIVGAGLAGLCCAVRLEQAGLSVKLLEAEDAPGGRIRTDQVDGFDWIADFRSCLPVIRKSFGTST